MIIIKLYKTITRGILKGCKSVTRISLERLRSITRVMKVFNKSGIRGVSRVLQE